MAMSEKEQAKPRKDLIVGSVNNEEKALIEQARERAGYKKMSPFVRDVVLERARVILTPKRRDEPKSQVAA